MLEFFARLHPLVVHLPIGILLLAAGLNFFGTRKTPGFSGGQNFPVIWLLGMASAWLACATGWFLAENGGHEADVLREHRAFGLGLAAVATAMWFFQKRENFRASAVVKFAYPAAIVFLTLLALHHGAILTHGKGYLLHGPEVASAEIGPAEKGLAPADDVPAEPVLPASPADLEALMKTGALVLPVAAGSNFLSVSAVNAPAFGDSAALKLEILAPQIVWLHLGGSAISDSALVSIGKLTHLSRLRLDGTRLTDAGLPALAALQNLRQLNLAGTKITAPGLAALRNLGKLQRIYLFKTGIAAADWDLLREAFPGVSLDSGGYFVPTFAADTVMLKPPEKK